MSKRHQRLSHLPILAAAFQTRQLFVPFYIAPGYWLWTIVTLRLWLCQTIN